jgi:beta-lactamase class D
MKNLLLLLFAILFAQTFTFAQVELQKPFQDCNLQGSITIYDYKNQKWIFSDEKDAAWETLPASTFKIINSLISLETGAVKDEREVLKWDGRKRQVEAWNADTDMENAFKNSTVWFYVEMAKRVGKDKYKHYLSESIYGNGNLDTGQEGDFWNYGSFGVSPKNQIKFLRRLYLETLPFSKRSFEIVKRMMVEEKTDNYVLRAKTGWTQFGGNDTGWWIGYVERKETVYFFATRVIKKRETQNPNFSPCRKEITKKILKELKII